MDPTNNFIISGSEDANIHVWSLFCLLSFSSASSPSAGQTVSSNSPIRTFSNHTGPITCIAVGHSKSRNNIAVSCSKDSTAVVWEYRTGKPLRTYLLPFPAISLEIDPADRAVYVGYEDGSIQIIDFFKTPSIQNILHDTTQQATPSQLSPNDRWTPPSADFGPAQCLSLSYDGMILLSGHKNGAVLRWDVAKGRFASTISNFNWPVTNLHVLPLTGLPRPPKALIVHNIVKPRIDHALSNASATGVVPATYTLQAHLTSPPSSDSTSPLDAFTTALSHPSFPSSLLSEGLLELTGQTPSLPQNSAPMTASDNDTSRISSLESELSSLKKQLSIESSARRALTSEVLDGRRRIAAAEAYVADLLDANDKLGVADGDDEKRRWNVLRRRAFHEAESKGLNGDRAVREMEREKGDVEMGM